MRKKIDMLSKLLLSLLLLISLLSAVTCINQGLASSDKEEGDRITEFETYSNPDYDFSIDYPSDWDEREYGLLQYEVVKFLAPDETPGAIEIFIIQVEPGMNLYDLVLTGSDKVRIISTVNTSIARIPAVEQVYYQYEPTATGKAKDALILRDNLDFIQIRYIIEPENFDTYLPTFDRMLQSFKMGSVE